MNGSSKRKKTGKKGLSNGLSDTVGTAAKQRKMKERTTFRGVCATERAPARRVREI